MKAATVVTGRPEAAGVSEVPDPQAGADELLVEGVLVGVCGTDREITRSGYGALPPGRDRLVLFHESLGRVLAAPQGSGFTAGDWVAGVVRRPDPEPCGACAQGMWDFCLNGRYTERGIKARDGYGSQRWTVETDFAVKLDAGLGELGVLTEPTSVVAKAWEQTEKIGARAYWAPRTALVTGAGPIGLLAALLGVQRGLEVHVLDRVTDGPKPQLIRDLGAIYHSGPLRCIADGGAARLEDQYQAGAGQRRGGGSVNANLGHYQAAAAALAAADRDWLSRLVTRPVASRATPAGARP